MARLTDKENYLDGWFLLNTRVANHLGHSPNGDVTKQLSLQSDE